MKKVRQTKKDELRAEYKRSDFPVPLVRGKYANRLRDKRSDFPVPLVRGKYANRLRESSNVIILKPEVAEAFPNEEAVNTALLSLIKLAQKTTRLTKRSTGRVKKLHAG